MRCIALFLCAAAAFVPGRLAAEIRYDPTNYKPFEFAEAENHLRLPFLEPERDWERIDVWVPRSAGEEPLPCILIYYGGGWGDKVVGGLKDEIAALLAAGYVVAMPDYVLRADHPVPLTVWDGAEAIRFLRANAAEYGIDPARIGAWGFSAGGWLIQFLGPSDRDTLYPVSHKQGNERITYPIPMLEPARLSSGIPLRLQGLVTDWGAGRLREERLHKLNPGWFGPNDPPLLTCHNVVGETPPGPLLYAAAGAHVETAHIEAKNTHVPSTASVAYDRAGNKLTWRARIHQFFEEQVKNPRRASAPEVFPAPEGTTGSGRVQIVSVHPGAAIHFTRDGSAPTANSPRYTEPLELAPGETLQAIAVVETLEPSAAATWRFPAEAAEPLEIAGETALLTARVGEPFEYALEATGGPVRWYLAGKRGTHYDKQRKPPGLVPWLEIDPATGRLYGTPDAPGTCVVIVAAVAADGEGAGRTAARRLLVRAEPAGE